MYYYKIFGLTICSQLKFIWPLERISPSGEIACNIIQIFKPIREPSWDLTYSSRIISSKTSQPKTQIFSSKDGFLLSFTGVAHFKIDAKQISFYQDDSTDQQEIESLLFQGALILWLELNGVSVLHGSGVAIRNSGIGFLANSAQGKSTLAAAFVRSGAKLFTDDIFPIELKINRYRVLPSYKWLRLLPEAVGALGYKTEQNNINLIKSVIPFDENYGEFLSYPVPLTALYLPMRKKNISAVSINTLLPKQAYLALLQHTFAGKWLMKSPVNIRRLSFLANLIKVIPIKQLVYPSGFEHLPAVVKAVRQDLSFTD